MSPSGDVPDPLSGTELHPSVAQTHLQQTLTPILQSSGIEYIGRGALANIIAETPQPAPSSLTAIPALEVLVQRDSGEDLDEPESRLQVDTAYGQAIRLFVDEIRQDSVNPEAIFITGMILFAIELLQRRHQDAWKHLLGSRQWLQNTTLINPTSKDIEFLYRIYDLQALLYSHGVRFPMIEPYGDSGLEDLDVEELTFTDLEKVTINVLHNARALLSRLHRAEVFGTLHVERQMEEEICLADLRLAVQFIDRKVHVSLEPQKESAYFILRNLCLMTIMDLEQARCRDEIAWDKYDEEFQCIIEAAEKIQLRHQWDGGLAEDSGRLHLTLQLGLIPPLALTAFKFRHPLWRRRATACLHKAGIEGPFIGKQLAAIAERCMEIEESGTRQPSVSTPEGSTSMTRLNVRMPTEDKRLAHCRVEEDNSNADQSVWPQTARGSTSVTFLARKYPESVLTAKVLTSTYFRTGDEYRSLQDRTLDTTVWRVWTEAVQFNGPLD